MLRTVIVDDEPLAINLLRNYCAQIPYIHVLETFTDALSCSDYLKKINVDLLFLDINMPDISGLEFFKSIKNPPAVIFSTAYSEYAVQGFDLSAVDYLLKPFDFDRFRKSVEKAKDQHYFKNQKIPKESAYIFIKSDYQLLKVNVIDIVLIEGLDDYIKIYTDGKMILTLMSLKAILEILPENEFVRVHRSFIVPLSKIRSMNKKSVRVGEQEIPIGNTYAQAFFSKVENSSDGLNLK